MSMYIYSVYSHCTCIMYNVQYVNVLNVCMKKSMGRNHPLKLFLFLLTCPLLPPSPLPSVNRFLNELYVFVRPPTAKGMKEDSAHNMYINGVTVVEVRSTEEAYEVLLQGKRKRRVAETQLNHDSSRSHAVFNIRYAHTRAHTHTHTHTHAHTHTHTHTCTQSQMSMYIHVHTCTCTLCMGHASNTASAEIHVLFKHQLSFESEYKM